jgi:hypothetical protein
VNEVRLLTYLYYNTSAMMDKAMNNLINNPPSQKPPPPPEAALKTEKSDVPIVGIGRQLEDTISSLAWGATSASTSASTSSSDVNEDNDRLIATNPSNTTQSNRKRPTADPNVDSGASDLTGIINLCDDDNKEEEKDTRGQINIDDTIAFPSLSPSSPSPTERPKKRTDIKRTPSKLDSRRSSTTASLTRLPLPSKAVLLSKKMKQSLDRRH